MKRLLLACVLLSSLASAGGKTPYPFASFGNIFNTPGGVPDFQNNVSYRHWLSDHFEMVLNGPNDWRVSLRDSDTSLPRIWVGPYASSQEINLYEPGYSGISYNDRLRDTTRHWLYVYAKSYLEDSVYLSVESLVVHIADNSVSINQHGDGFRSASNIQSLPYHKRRFTYQYWNNTSDDTAFYPMGYVWLANGYCDQTAAAIASAFYRAFIGNPQKLGWPAQEWDCYYMDNHARRLSFLAYWDLVSSSGGQEPSYLEWVEGDTLPIRENNGSYVLSSMMHYFDNAVMKIDSAIQSRLMNGSHNIRGFANVYISQPADLSLLLPHVAGVTFESPLDYNLSWGAWKQIIASFDTLANYPDKYSFLEYRGDFLCQNSGWLADTSRVIMYGYAFYLAMRSPGTFFGPHEIHQGKLGSDRRCWQDAFYVDLGEPDSSWRKIDSTGTGDWTDKSMIIYRSYGQNAVILRTGYSSANFSSDYKAVNLHGMYREIDGWTGDTSSTADSIFYLRPYEGKILVAGNLGPCDYPPSVPVPASPTLGAENINSPNLCVYNSSHGACPSNVSYQFELASDAEFSSIVKRSNWIGEGFGSTCFPSGVTLPNGHRYYWRCRANNGNAISRWSTVYDFTSPNLDPGLVQPIEPPNQSAIEILQPVLSVSNAVDPEGAPLVYFFELSTNAEFYPPVIQSPSIREGSPYTDWEVGTPLENETKYFWRVRAFDDISYGPWSDTMTFTIDASLENLVTRGDINTNGVANEVADAVMFTNYFLSGLSAFGNHVEASIIATDANNDNLTLSVADLVYLIRIIAGTAEAYPKIKPRTEVVNLIFNDNGSNLEIDVQSPAELGAVHIELEFSGTEIKAPYLTRETNHMNMRYSAQGDYVKVLVYSTDGNRHIPAGFHKLIRIPFARREATRIKSVDLSDHLGRTLKYEIEENPASPVFELRQNYPNPFNATTTITYYLPEESQVELAVFNILGQKVKTLVEGRMPPGLHRVEWDATDDAGHPVASGIYIYKLVADRFAAKKSLVLIK